MAFRSTLNEREYNAYWRSLNPFRIHQKAFAFPGFDPRNYHGAAIGYRIFNDLAHPFFTEAVKNIRPKSLKREIDGFI